MVITILTLFPDGINAVFSQSICARAINDGKVLLNTINIRDFATDTHKSVDDKPFGGGVGMIMRVDVIDRAISFARSQTEHPSHVILLGPTGSVYNQKKAHALAKKEHLIFLCGHYEGVDARVTALVDETISLGDFVTTGGEAAVIPIVDSIIRLVPNVLKQEATLHESFAKHLLEHPQYTRPRHYKGMGVPEVLLCGDPKKINAWKTEESIKLTKQQRPELITD